MGFLLNFDDWQFWEQKGLNSLFTCAVLDCLSVQDGFIGEQKKITSHPVLTALSFGYLLLGGNVIIETEGL